MTYAGLIGSVIGLINVIIPVLIGVAMIVFFWGLTQYIYQAGDTHSHDRGREIIIWGLASMFVMVSIWGIIALMREALNL